MAGGGVSGGPTVNPAVGRGESTIVPWTHRHGNGVTRVGVLCCEAMSELPITDGPVPGLRVLLREVTLWAWSPDGRWLATSDPVDHDGQGVVRVYDHEDGREALTIRGHEALALAWPSGEHLLVVRVQSDVGARAVLHAVPDGGVLGTAVLRGMPRVRVRVSMSATRHPDLCAERALLVPASWTGGLRENVRQRTGFLLSLPELEVVSSITPDLWTVLPRLPHVRPAAATLSPDGEDIAVWLGTPSTDGTSRTNPGTLWLQPWRGGNPRRVCTVGRDVDSLVYCDPSRLLLQSVSGTRTLKDRGDVALADVSRGVVLYDSRLPQEEATEPGWVGGAATVDVHPDRERAVIGGRVAAGSRWRGALQTIDLGSGLTPTKLPAEFGAKPELGLSAAYTGDGEALAVLAGAAPRTGHVTLWRTFAEGALEGHPGWQVLLEGKMPRAARVTRSPGGVGVTVSWQVDGRALRKGTLTPTTERLAWITRETLQAVLSG